MLTIVATPIGNLKDITLRALETLGSVDGIICEDSRHTSILLNHFEIKKPLLVLNDFNESREFPRILGKLQNGQNLALVSDAGTPLISDPGYKLIRECLQSGVVVDSLPGPTSIITALTLSGLPPDKFVYLGYLPEKSGKRSKALEEVKNISKESSFTYIVLVAPHKLVRTLEGIQETLGDITITLARELTKMNQEVKSESVSEWLKIFTKKAIKGEFVLLFHL